MKTLNTIQTISKIGKILSKIIYICCIIGVAGCIVGMVSIPFADTGVLKIGGVTISGLIVNRARIELAGLYPLLTGAMIVCIGQCITAKFAELFFKHELSAGTHPVRCKGTVAARNSHHLCAPWHPDCRPDRQQHYGCVVRLR